MIAHFRKYQTYHLMRRFHRQACWEAQLMDKSKIEGAYLLLKRFKNRLKTFDSALSKVHTMKVDKKDFETLKVSLDKDRAASIFNDMKLLFDTTIGQFDEKCA